jgi:hypothetical protein
LLSFGVHSLATTILDDIFHPGRSAVLAGWPLAGRVPPRSPYDTLDLLWLSPRFWDRDHNVSDRQAPRERRVISQPASVADGDER